MSHFATTAFIRKRAAEKHTEKHIEKSTNNCQKSNEKSLQVPDAGRTPFWPHFGMLFGRFWLPNSVKIGKMTGLGAV